MKISTIEIFFLVRYFEYFEAHPLKIYIYIFLYLVNKAFRKKVAFEFDVLYRLKSWKIRITRGNRCGIADENGKLYIIKKVE